MFEYTYSQTIKLYTSLTSFWTVRFQLVLFHEAINIFNISVCIFVQLFFVLLGHIVVFELEWS